MAAADLKLAFVGAGQMARALAAGFVRAGCVSAGQIRAADPHPEAREAFQSQVPGAEVSSENREAAAAADVVILAVKPPVAPAALSDLRAALTDKHLLVSVVAGLRLEAMASQLKRGVRLVRVMPNTPCLIGRSASGFSLGSGATQDDATLVGALLGAVGTAFLLPEESLDAVTGLSGSGPAFVYIMIEALSDGGVLMGLPREVATRLAAQTVAGAAEMVLSGDAHPAELKDRVASPGGTTMAGLAKLETGGMRAALIGAVQAATRRAIELGQSS